MAFIAHSLPLSRVSKMGQHLRMTKRRRNCRGFGCIWVSSINLLQRVSGLKKMISLSLALAKIRPPVYTMFFQRWQGLFCWWHVPEILTRPCSFAWVGVKCFRRRCRLPIVDPTLTLTFFLLCLHTPFSAQGLALFDKWFVRLIHRVCFDWLCEAFNQH